MKLGAYTIYLRVASVLISILLALEPVVGENLLLGTMKQCNTQATTVSPPKVSPGTHLSICLKEGMGSWEGQDGSRTKAHIFLARRDNQKTKDALTIICCVNNMKG